MSDCKHEKRTDYIYIESSHYVSYCQHCDADFTHFELETLERAEKAEARVKELEDIVHGIGKLLEENGHTVNFTLKANRLITKCHELFRTENK